MGEKTRILGTCPRQIKLQNSHKIIVVNHRSANEARNSEKIHHGLFNTIQNIDPPRIEKLKKNSVQTTGGGNEHRSRTDCQMNIRKILGRYQQGILRLCEQHHHNHAHKYTSNMVQGTYSREDRGK